MLPVDPLLLDLSFLTRLDFCTLYYLVAVAGIAYGIKTESGLTVLIAVLASSIFGIILLAGIILVLWRIH